MPYSVSDDLDPEVASKGTIQFSNIIIPQVGPRVKREKMLIWINDLAFVVRPDCPIV